MISAKYVRQRLTRNKKYMKKYQKEYRKNLSIKDGKNDTDYPPFVNNGHDPLDTSSLGFR